MLVGGVHRTFHRVIHMRPDGGSKVVHQTTAGELVHFVEVGLVPRSGLPIAVPEGEGEEEEPAAALRIPSLHGAIQICGITGRVRLYLP
jgi:hypothetical protein